MELSNLWTRVRGQYQRKASRLFSRRRLAMRNGIPFISFTFDDFPRSALHGGGAILSRYGLRGTYYVSLGLIGQEIPAGSAFSVDDLRQVIAERHELGCHTFAHCDAWKTKPGVFEESIIENKRVLGELVPGAEFATHSYPISCPRPQTKRRAAKYFICCRGGGQTFNVGATDLNNLRAYFLEKIPDNPAAITRLIDENCRARGWLIFATHDVCSKPTRYGCTPGVFEGIVRYAVNSGARVLPVAEALEAIRGNHSLTWKPVG